MQDVAALAGVSTATVSRALSGLGSVSPRTREKVLRAAQELKYIASPSASSLASGRMSTVGVVTPYISRWFFAEVLNGIEHVLQSARFDLVLYIDNDGRLFQSLPMKRRVDAVLFLTLPSDTPDVAGVASLGIPVGSLGVEIPGFSSVKIDDVEGAKLAVNHLLGLGHRRIGMVTLESASAFNFSTPQDRTDGYRQALRAAGIKFDPSLVVKGHSSIEGGREAATTLLGMANRPTALFVQSDEMAMGVLQTLRRVGLRCPEDISVIGFDNHELSSVFDLTTVAQPAFDQGAKLASFVLDQVMTGASPQQAVLGTQLILRGTTAPPGIA